MKVILLSITILLLLPSSYGQKYKRKQFDYEKIVPNHNPDCPEGTLEKGGDAMKLIDQLNSKKAATFSKELFEETENCPFSHELYSWSLFRSGEWIAANKIIDSSIDKFGGLPDLVLRRGYMCVEMAELGVGIRNIDGNSVYLGSGKKLKFKEKKFVTENLKTALNDFKYLANTYQDRHQEIYMVGYIYQSLKDYENSNSYLNKILLVEEYRDQVTLLIADNYIQLKKYNDAEDLLNNLVSKYPKNSKIQQQLIELYEVSGQTDKIEIAKKKGQFYYWVPEYTNLPYSEDNYSLIRFFLADNSTKDKLAKLDEVMKLDHLNKADILITILNTHANHGNGIETRAEELLIQMGSPVVDNVIQLLNNASSTCTITKAASILAEIKDPKGWEPLINYLPRMENIPFTMIPPDVPEQIIKFDKEKGLIVLLTWIKNQDEKEAEPDNPFGELGNLFSAGSTYSPMKIFTKEEIRESAKIVNYTDEEITTLLVNIFGEENTDLKDK